MLFWYFSLCSGFFKFHHEIDKLESILYKNSYPRALVDKCIKEFLDKILAPKTITSTLPKQGFTIALPYLGKLFLQTCAPVKRKIKNKLLYCHTQFVFHTKCKISNIFTFKNRIPSSLSCGIVYKF